MKVVSCLLLLMIGLSGLGQTLRISQIGSLRVHSTNCLADSLGACYGCHLELECRGIGLLLTNAAIDYKARTVSLIGYADPNVGSKDTIGAIVSKLFVGQPNYKKGQIANRTMLIELDGDSLYCAPGCQLNLETYRFQITAPIAAGSHLFITANGMYRLLDIRLDKLFEK